MSSIAPTDEERRRTELQARVDRLRSLRVIRRFAWKVGIFVCFALGHGAAGHGFLRSLETLALASTVVAIGVGHWRRERVAAPHYTSFDEAAWFMLLAFVLARQP